MLNSSKLRITALALVAFVPAAFAAKDVVFSGFLGDYEGFEPSKEAKGAWIYKSPKLSLADYTNVMIDDVEIRLHEEAKGVEIEPEALEMLADYFKKAAAEQVQDAYPVVDQPGPLVVRVRAAITDVKPGSATKQIVGKAVPGAAGMTAGVPVPLKIPIGIGAAWMEAELVDSETGERVAGIVDKRKQDRGLPVISTFNFSRYKEFAGAKDAFDFWAKRLRIAMDKSHGVEE